MRSMQLVLQLIVYCISLKCGLVSCIANLKYYETFNHIGVTSKVKRSHGTQEPIKEVKFKAFARDFHLILKTGTDVLADDFLAELVDGAGETTPIFFDGSNLYTGYLEAVSGPQRNIKIHHTGQKTVKKKKKKDLMISFITLANNIYGNTDFLDSKAKVHRLNVLAGKIRIFTAYSKSTNPEDPHYNSISDWTAEMKLDSFAMAMSYRDQDYCHSHLFTSYGMANRILGLAWVSGVCAREDQVVGHVPSLQLNLVFVHGHSLGARHDSDIAECAPSEAYGGRFIMWDQSVMGDEPNHKLFSKCSIWEIGRTLEGSSCLKAKVRVPSLCGNGILDKGEECDAGAFGLVGIDKCCQKDCKLLPGKICSDLNVNCCFNCQTAPNTTTCGHSPVRDCKGNSYCSGDAYECLPPVNKPDAESCWDGGECFSGVCKHFCDKQGLLTGSVLKSCMCINPFSDACKWCCFNITNPNDVGPCIPYSDNYVYDGRPCFAGYCKVLWAEQGV